MIFLLLQVRNFLNLISLPSADVYKGHIKMTHMYKK
jgi:hypothetical protein